MWEGLVCGRDEYVGGISMWEGLVCGRDEYVGGMSMWEGSSAQRYVADGSSCCNNKT